jgi:hypothetical protein
LTPTRYPVLSFPRHNNTVKAILLLLVPVLLAADSVPHVSSVDYYGLRKVSQSRVYKAVGVSAGDPLPPSKGELEERLEKIPGVVTARVEAVCCDGREGMLFVGIEERGAAHFALRSAPAGDAALPAEIVAQFTQLVRTMEDAARRGSTAEDLTHGHPLMADPDARAIQEGFADFTATHLSQVRDVLRNSAGSDQRAMAATLIGYAADKKAVVNDLEFAMQDPDEDVRSSAMRALNAIAVLGIKQPQLALNISPTWFVEMMNSVVLSDRTRATLALISLTDSRPAATLDLLRERALPSLVEMAQWNSLRHALPAYILLGRVGGLSEQQIQESWTKGDRAAMVLQVVGSAAKKKRR